MTKKCIRCNKKKKLNSFSIDRSRKFGIKDYCLACNKILSDSDYQKNKKQRKRKHKEWREKNKEYHNKLCREHYYKNKSRYNENNKKWLKNHPEYMSYARDLRRAQVKQALPNWADKIHIRKIYDNRPKDMVVDHIVPLQGKNVRGLHVPWNLTYLTKHENQIKSNKLLTFLLEI